MLESVTVSRMRRPHWSLCFLLLCLLQSCAIAVRNSAESEEWPPYLPGRELFERAWEQDAANQRLQSEEEYLLWVRRFFEGFAGTPGWREMSVEVASRIDPATAAEAAPLLAGLGVRISREWAKDNSVRRIDTRMVSVWRTALAEALWVNDLLPFLQRLEDDISGLLAGTLAPELIDVDRYYLIEEPEFE
jgi:hypothetical protein